MCLYLSLINSSTHISASMFGQKAFAGHNFAHLIWWDHCKGVLYFICAQFRHLHSCFKAQPKGSVHNIARLLSSLQKGHVPPSTPNPNTHILTSTLRQKAFAGHNITHLLNSPQKGHVPPSTPNPDTHIPPSTLGQKVLHIIIWLIC
jgi:hypothetical protein